MASFLNIDICSDDITYTKIYGSQFAKKHKNFDEGKLKYLDMTRIKVCRFQVIEDKINDLLEAN